MPPTPAVSRKSNASSAVRTVARSRRPLRSRSKCSPTRPGKRQRRVEGAAEVRALHAEAGDLVGGRHHEVAAFAHVRRRAPQARPAGFAARPGPSPVPAWTASPRATPTGSRSPRAPGPRSPGSDRTSPASTRERPSRRRTCPSSTGRTASPPSRATRDGRRPGSRSRRCSRDAGRPSRTGRRRRAAQQTSTSVFDELARVDAARSDCAGC